MTEYKSRCGYYLKMLPKGNGRLLDVGCDQGVFSGAYLSHHKASSVIGLDVEKELIDAANQNYGSHTLTYQWYDGNIFPFEDNAFDVVSATETLEHVGDEALFLKELNRVTKPNGTILLSVPHKGVFDFMDVFNFRFLFPRKLFTVCYTFLKGKPPVFDKNRSWHRHYSKKQVLSLLKDNDWEVLESHRKGLFFFYMSWIFGGLIYQKFPNKVTLGIRRVIEWLNHYEYQISFGPMAANLLFLFRKNEHS
ncbi:MAG: class I SAM-dependent methyltransferase [Candidatus Margulisbacteria bacterium]|nr:class I SAM-dependent methyltransferase [Candidatus Margulisiibacteriota bacterium]